MTRTRPSRDGQTGMNSTKTLWVTARPRWRGCPLPGRATEADSPSAKVSMSPRVVTRSRAGGIFERAQASTTCGTTPPVEADDRRPGESRPRARGSNSLAPEASAPPRPRVRVPFRTVRREVDRASGSWSPVMGSMTAVDASTGPQIRFRSSTHQMSDFRTSPGLLRSICAPSPPGRNAGFFRRSVARRTDQRVGEARRHRSTSLMRLCNQTSISLHTLHSDPCPPLS
jgi:hypothetical protein